MLKVNIGEIRVKQKINIGEIKLGVKKVKPPLENLEVIPSGIEQNFKSNKYGYDNVKVKAVASDTLDITPTKEKQQHIGLYGTVNVEEVNSSIDENIKAENIKKGVSILGVEGNLNIKTIHYGYISAISFASNVSEITEDMYLDLPQATNLNGMFFAKNVNCEKITVVVSNVCTNLVNAFWGTNNAKEGLKTIEILGDTSKITHFTSAFRNRTNLERIIGDLDFSSVTTINGFDTMIMNDGNLKEFFPKAGTIKTTINLNNSAKFTDKTIQSIIDGLADITGGTAQTLTLHTNVKARLTDEQIASITSKNWNLA